MKTAVVFPAPSWPTARIPAAVLGLVLALPVIGFAQSSPSPDPDAATPVAVVAAAPAPTTPGAPAAPEDGQQPTQAQPGDLPSTPAAPPTTLQKLFGPTRISSTADTYYEYNSNEPASGQNLLRNFDEKDNQFSFSYFELAFEQVPTAQRRVGFRADLGFGPTASWVNSTDPDDGALKYLQQGYVSVLAPVGKGLQIDAGKFNTPIGAEPTETAYNWNYSRSLLFAWAAPYYHVGVRATLPVTDAVSVSGFLVNGWNNAQDNNRDKTIATAVSWKVLPSLTLSQAWMGGAEGPNGTDNWRNLYDTIATWTVNDRLSLMANMDIGRDTINGVTTSWQGVAAYGRVVVLPTWALASRAEVFEDNEGFMTGTAQTIREVTLTSEHMLVKGLSIRFEYRRDWSTEDFFEYKEDQFRDHQNTFLVGFIYSFATP
jgi:hypothetical protein